MSTSFASFVIFFTAAKPRRSMDHRITVGGRGGWVLNWKILWILFKFKMILYFKNYLHCPCRRRSIGPLPSCLKLLTYKTSAAEWIFRKNWGIWSTPWCVRPSSRPRPVAFPWIQWDPCCSGCVRYFRHLMIGYWSWWPRACLIEIWRQSVKNEASTTHY